MDSPTARRVSYSDHARRAAAGAIPDDPEAAGRAAVAATHLAPLQGIQVAFDQLHSVQAARLRGEPWPHSATYDQHYADVMKHARSHAEILAVAAAAARSMIDETSAHLQQIEDHMAEEHPKLTDDGSPHPLEAGGYDPAADPQLPSNVSDVEALKEGKTTRKQAEAIAKADADAAGAKADEGSDAAPAPGPGPGPAADPRAKEPAKAPILTPSRQQAGPPPPPKPDRR